MGYDNVWFQLQYWGRTIYHLFHHIIDDAPDEILLQGKNAGKYHTCKPCKPLTSLTTSLVAHGHHWDGPSSIPVPEFEASFTRAKFKLQILAFDVNIEYLPE